MFCRSRVTPGPWRPGLRPLCSRSTPDGSPLGPGGLGPGPGPGGPGLRVAASAGLRAATERAARAGRHWWDRYEEVVGLTELREAQSKVTQAEGVFLAARGAVREAQARVDALQVQLRQARDRLERVERDDARYLELATEEHRLLQEERAVRANHVSCAHAERDAFSAFSAAVRESHEKERARTERTKNWSLIGSIVGAVLGIAGSTYINRVRLHELRQLVGEARGGPESLQEALREQAAAHAVQCARLASTVAQLHSVLHDVDTTRTQRPPAPTPISVEAAPSGSYAGGPGGAAAAPAWLVPLREAAERSDRRLAELLVGVRELRRLARGGAAGAGAAAGSGESEAEPAETTLDPDRKEPASGGAWIAGTAGAEMEPDVVVLSALRDTEGRLTRRVDRLAWAGVALAVGAAAVAATVVARGG